MPKMLALFPVYVHAACLAAVSNIFTINFITGRRMFGLPVVSKKQFANLRFATWDPEWRKTFTFKQKRTKDAINFHIMLPEWAFMQIP